MNAEAEGSAKKKRTIRSVVLGLITIVLVVFFTIPSYMIYYTNPSLPAFFYPLSERTDSYNIEMTTVVCLLFCLGGAFQLWGYLLV
jgi:hypothetical protein